MKVIRKPLTLNNAANNDNWSKIKKGPIQLGSHGVCGLSWNWKVTGDSIRIKTLASVMSHIPVATFNAFELLHKNPKICSELFSIFDRADTMELNSFKDLVATVLDEIGIEVKALYPNNCIGIQKSNHGGMLSQKQEDQR